MFSSNHFSKALNLQYNIAQTFQYHILTTDFCISKIKMIVDSMCWKVIFLLFQFYKLTFVFLLLEQRYFYDPVLPVTLNPYSKFGSDSDLVLEGRISSTVSEFPLLQIIDAEDLPILQLTLNTSSQELVYTSGFPVNPKILKYLRGGCNEFQFLGVL